MTISCTEPDFSYVLCQFFAKFIKLIAKGRTVQLRQQGLGFAM